MDEAGIKFLDKLYGNLYMSDVVQHTKENSDNRVEAIRKYLERLEKLHKFATTEARKEHVLNLYYDKYVIKEKDMSYVENSEQIINAQKKRLAMWISYLTDPTTSYPLWAKYWAFQGMLKMGSYDEVKGVYLKRDKKTIAPFVEPNPEIIAKSITTIMRLVNGEDIDDMTEARLSKTDSFSKIYTTFEKEYKKNIQEKSGSDDGVWIKYNQGSEEDAIKLSKTLHNKNTGWCTAGDETMAISQVCGPYSGAPEGGDFYVYYTKDEDGKYTVPRIALRCNGHKRIGEIRGIAPGQNLEEEMLDVLENKLKSMDFLDKDSVDKNLDTVYGLIELYEIARKTESNTPLTSEEINNLYTKNYGFGWYRDPKVEKVLEKRKIEEDFKMMSPEAGMKIVCKRSLPSTVKIDDEDFLREAIKREPSAFVYASERLLQDRDFIKYALSEGARTDNATHLKDFELIPEEFRTDKEIVMLMTDNNPHALQYASDELKANEEVVTHAITHSYHSREAFIYAADKFKGDRDYVLKMTKEHNTELLQFVKKELQDDKELVLEAIKVDTHQFIFASKRLKDDKEVVKEVLSRDTSEFRYISDRLKDDKELVLEIVKKDSSVIRYISERLCDDKEVILEALKATFNSSSRAKTRVLAFASDKIKDDKEFVLNLLEKKNIPGTIIKDVSDRLKDDEHVVMSALKNYRSDSDIDIIYLWISPRLKKHPMINILVNSLKNEYEREQKRRAAIPDLLREIGESKIKKEK